MGRLLGWPQTAPGSTMASAVRIAAIITVTLALAAWGESDELSDLKERLAIVEQRLDRVEAYRVVDKHVCADEYDQALEYTTSDTSDHAIPAIWDGRPFVVDISSTFGNANELLDVVADEAEQIREFLGYEIFVAGDVLPLDDILSLTSVPPHLMPPNQHIEISCCVFEGDDNGYAYPSWRIIRLGTSHPEHASVPSRHAIIHELYHLLGFVHPGKPVGVVMSDPLMYGDDKVKGWVTVNGRRGSFPTTRSTPLDLAKLNCIYGADSAVSLDWTVAQ